MPPPVPQPVSWFRQVTRYSVLAGVCPLIPIPFLDDRALASVKRRMTTTLARERGVTLTERQRDFLSGTYGESRGCLARAGGLAFKLTFKLIAKIFRKLLIFLALEEASHVASRTFHEGYLLHLLFDPSTGPAWGDGSAPGRPPGETEAWQARWAIEQVVAESDPRPVNQAIRRTFRGSRSLLRQGSRRLGRSMRRGGGEERAATAEAEEERMLSDVVDPLASSLWSERGYLEALETRFRHWYRTATTTGHSADDAPDPA